VNVGVSLLLKNIKATNTIKNLNRLTNARPLTIADRKCINFFIPQGKWQL